MKIKQISALIACSALLSFSLWAVPNDLHTIELNDRTSHTLITQDENELTKIVFTNNGEEHQLTLTPQEISDRSQLKERLSELPESTQNKLFKLISRLYDQDSGKIRVFHSQLSEADKAKLAKLTEKMTHKHAEFAKHSAKFEAKSAEMEAKAAELEAKAREFEIIFEKNGGEFEREMERLAIEITKLTEGMNDIDFDIDVDLEMSDIDDKHFVVINEDSVIETEQLIKLIKSTKLSPQQAEQVQRALETATVK
ncbi:hypothetical protein K0I73_11065 [Shewanella mesophila]|uniref:hypothetical protein n=1 Tax=Shewanella mesophila TaxID=2864208 RepID=UPI001C655B4E|nr:hypothetical protein [Shewanella mesophila]QYJ84802.1 hypothetical protein K0I73_11065 [Shewanella mesophila]